MKNLADFIFELGMFKKIEHCGVKFAGVRHPDTLGEHTCRTAQIGFILGMHENADPEHTAALCLVHDVGEIRIGDSHKIAQRYLCVLPAEKKAILEQTENLPSTVKKYVRALWQEFHDQKTLESRIARDADLLETIFQAKEYVDVGFKAAKRWTSNGGKFLKTKTAKRLFKAVLKTEFTDWWDILNKYE